MAEVGVVLVNRHGQIVDRWESLINPNRDLGPQHIHGIRAADIIQAPTFEELAPTLSRLLAGSVLVAHNLAFDALFLEHEFAACNAPLSAEFLNGLCTMRMAHTYLPGAGRSLRDCCDSFSIDMGRAHSAGDDAYAAAELLGRYIDLDRDLPHWDEYLERASMTGWTLSPDLASIAPVLRRPSDYVDPHFLGRIAMRLPEFCGPVEHEQYLSLLDRALLDRHISSTEGAALVELANDLGISRRTIGTLHEEYVRALVHVAWSDSVVTPEEEHDLRMVAKLLDVSDDLLADAFNTPPAEPGRAIDFHEGLTPGDMIVLTGQMERERSELEDLIVEAGFVPHSGVTKKVKLVVAADPDSLSGKARKARDYGIPVVSESYLLQLIGA